MSVEVGIKGIWDWLNGEGGEGIRKVDRINRGRQLNESVGINYRGMF